MKIVINKNLKTNRVNVSIDTEVLTEAVKICDSKDRSFSNATTVLWREEIKRRAGSTKPEPQEDA